MNVEALVAKDCPAGLLGAFHEGRRTLLLCGNNLPDDPKVVWVVLAHESVHVMQFCHGGPLMPANLFTQSLDQARHQDPGLFKELKLYHASQHQLGGGPSGSGPATRSGGGAVVAALRGSDSALVVQECFRDPWTVVILSLIHI